MSATGFPQSTNTFGLRSKEGTLMSTQEPSNSADALKAIMAPLSLQINSVAAQTDIVFVVHKPDESIGPTLRKWRVGDRPVFGMSSFDAARVADWDVLTRRWLSERPAEAQVKVFLLAGEGTALLTLTMRDGFVLVDKEPDLFEVSPPIDDSVLFGTGKTRVITGRDSTRAKGSKREGQPVVIISNEHGVIVGRQFLQEMAAGKRPAQAVFSAAGPTADLMREFAAAIEAEPIRIVLPAERA